MKKISENRLFPNLKVICKPVAVKSKPLKKTNKKYDLTLASSLYQFSSTSVLNAKAGIRKASSISKASSLKVYAAENYPAVYFLDYAGTEISVSKSKTSDRRTSQ